MTHNPFITHHIYIPSHSPNSSTLLPILLETTHSPTAFIPTIIILFLILPHPRIPLLFFSSNKRLKPMLLTSSEVDWSDLSLGNGFGYKDVFYA